MSRGRPVGSVETPRSMLQREVKETVRLNQQLREFATRMLEKLKVELEEGGGLKDKLEVLTTLAEMLAQQARSLDSMAKHLPAVGEEGEDRERESSPQEVLDEFYGRPV